MDNAGQDSEICIICGKATQYKKSDNIDFRSCYVEGAGQSCIDCYEPLYNKDNVDPLIQLCDG